MIRNWLAGIALVLSSGSLTLADTKTGKLNYARDVQPILSAHCFNCHGPDVTNRKGGLRLDTPEGALAVLRSGEKAVVPGHPEKSELITRIFKQGRGQMPPTKSVKGLSDGEKAKLKQWILEGAEYQRHWAFVKPGKPSLPIVKDVKAVRNSIDAFVLSRLESQGLSFSPEADRYTLARRIALDLTGLPPKQDQVIRFVKDPSPNAYEAYVDEVMKSPAFGERWASVWLDLARYADSNGYAEDQARTIWKYRDWVIQAFNDNMPFDRFTIEQIAGDMLPGAKDSQLIATAFHRNTLSNSEGGTNDEEFRNIAVIDRVNTTLQVWMAITVNCAQCHDHKYDPISQEEYYQFFAIFNQSEDADRADNSPNLLSLTPEEQKRKAQLEADISQLGKEMAQAAPELDKRQAAWEKDALASKEMLAKVPAKVQAILKLDSAKRNPMQKAELTKFYRGVVSDVKALQVRVNELKAELAKVQPVPTPIMRELPEKKHRVTKIHLRGDWLNLGKEVKSGVPAAFHPLAKGDAANRLGLAHWLVSPDNPLTSRVAVNRFWDQIFGVSLVETPEDFGMRSKPPTHPLLLDYLATEFSGPMKWDVKQLLKQIVTSATYRQSSKVTPDLLERDPANRYFARGPRFRSSAEVIRDQALFAAGLLSPKMLGPSVRPPQPKLGLSAAFGPGTDWTNSTGDDKYRRGVYTSWRRATPYPSMITFDAPGRTTCALTRPRTNTPLQALVTLNDPCYVEAAQALARRMMKEGGKSAEEQVRHGFQLVLVRPPQPGETHRLVALYEKARQDFAKSAKEATLLATDPLGPLPSDVNAIDAAALTVVANVLLNLDETFAKR